MNITWVTRSFLDYRIPVFASLNEQCGNRLTLIYNAPFIPPKVNEKTKKILGVNAWGLTGEYNIGFKENLNFANKGGNIPFQPGLLKAIRRSQPDVIVCDGFFQWTFAAIFHHLVHGTPIVMCYERTMHTERTCPWYRTWYRKIVMRSIAHICCNGVLSAEYVRHLGYPADKISCGHMAADIEGLTASEDSSSPNQILFMRKKYGVLGIMFLFVGRMIPLKGLKYLLEAYRHFQANFPGQVTLILVGDGPEMGAYQSMGIPGVVFAGNCPYDEIASFYRAADVFIIPTLEDNWSLVVPEAMACGLPIASSVYNGCHPELVTPENGWIFDPLDAESIRNVLHRIVSARDSLPEMGQKSHDIVFASHTPAHAAKAVLNACQQVLSLCGKKQKATL